MTNMNSWQVINLSMRYYLRYLADLSKCNQSFRFSSSLYMTGDKAKSNFSYISPYLDFESKFENVPDLERNVVLRGIPINIQSLKRMWDFQEGVRNKRNQLERKRMEIAKSIKNLMNNDSCNDKSEIEKLKLMGQKLKRELKVITSSLWDIEDKVMPKLLLIPNELHPKTPERLEKTLHTYLDQPRNKCILNHIDVGNTLRLLTLIGPMCYYLTGDAVKFELGSIQYFVNLFRERDYSQFSNPDFLKSVVVEGCGMDHEDPMTSFILKRNVADGDDETGPNRVHLVGGASIGPFCSYFAKQITKEPLPIKLFASGRQYNPSAIHLNGSLINTCQASAVHFFVALENNVDAQNSIFEEILSYMVDAYENFGYHFKVVYLPAQKLKSWESLRVSFQMYSSFSQAYVEVGNLSVCDNYISKRLLLYYQKPDKGIDFLRIITGTAISIPKVLACVLEDQENHYKGKLKLPFHVKSYFSNIL